MIRILAVFACLTASLALAQNVPGSITFNARLTDTGGAPITGAHALGFGLYNSTSGGAAVWTENVSGASFSTEGVAFVELGAVTPLTTSALDGSKLYLEVSVDGTTMTPRLAIVSVPYAIRASVAATAGSVGSLTESAIQRRVTGTCPAGQAMRSIDTAGAVQCEPVGAGDITSVTTAFGSGLTGGALVGDVPLSLASCAAGEVLKSGGASWACAADVGATYGVTAPLALTGTTLSLSGCPNNQVLRSNGTTWICADVGTLTGVTTAAGSGLAGGGSTGSLPLTLTPCANGQVLKFGAGGWACAAAGGGDVGNLIANYEFEDVASPFSDLSGFGANATFSTGLTAGAVGHTGAGVNFAGGIATVATGNSIPSAPQVFVEAWIWPQTQAGVTSGVIAEKEGAWALRYVTGASAASDLDFRVVGRTAAPNCQITTTGAQISTSTWTHVAAYYDGLNVAIAINGSVAIQAVCAKGALAANLGSMLTLGGPVTGAGERYLGYLDELRIRSFAQIPTRAVSKTYFVRAKGGANYCVGSYQDIAGLTVTFTAVGSRMEIFGDVPVYYGGHSALRATVNGVYAGVAGGVPWSYVWQDGIQCTSCGGCGNWTNLHYQKVFDGFTPGTIYTVRLQIFTDSACSAASCGLTVGNGSMDGFLSVRDLP